MECMNLKTRKTGFACTSNIAYKIFKTFFPSFACTLLARKSSASADWPSLTTVASIGIPCMVQKRMWSKIIIDMHAMIIITCVDLLVLEYNFGTGTRTTHRAVLSEVRNSHRARVATAKIFLDRPG